jgi:hypothetical protein
MHITKFEVPEGQLTPKLVVVKSNLLKLRILRIVKLSQSYPSRNKFSFVSDAFVSNTSLISQHQFNSQTIFCEKVQNSSGVERIIGQRNVLSASPLPSALQF